MTERHTPGPWLSQGICYEGDERGSCGIIADNLGGLVGMALPWPTELDDGDFPRVEANARLMAAAPDMLAALQAFVHANREMQDYQLVEEEAKARRMAVAAIAKASKP